MRLDRPGCPQCSTGLARRTWPTIRRGGRGRLLAGAEQRRRADDAKGGEAAAQKAKPKGKKAKAKKEAEAEEFADEGDEADLEEDGIQDMDDKKGGIFG